MVRVGVVLALVLLAACQREANFDERFANASATIANQSAAMDNQMRQLEAQERADDQAISRGDDPNTPPTGNTTP